MKKFWLLLFPAFLLIGCNEDEIDDLKQDYLNGHKSEELVGFWNFRGGYKTSSEEDFHIGTLGMSKGQILHLSRTELFILSKKNNEYTTNKYSKLYWYNNDIFIKTLDLGPNYSTDYYNSSHAIESNNPYKFGETNDTLIVQSDSETYYFLKTEEVAYEFITFE